MAQSVGHESLAVVLTGIGPVFAFALLSVRCTCMMYCPLLFAGRVSQCLYCNTIYGTVNNYFLGVYPNACVSVWAACGHVVGSGVGMVWPSEKAPLCTMCVMVCLILI